LKTKKKPLSKSQSAKASIRKIGIFGGTFNPFHLGHLNSLLAVQKEFSLSKILVIPSHQTPGKPVIVSPTPEERLEMVKLGLKDYQKNLAADDREILRGGESFTIETLKDLIAENPKAEIYLIIGADLLSTFHTWRNWQEILERANMIVTSRPGNLLPFKKDDLPEPLRKLAGEVGRQKVALTSGKTIQYFQLKDKEISGTEIRKCVRAGLRVDKFLSMPVEKYIKEHGLYRPSAINQIDFKQVTEFVGDVLFDKKGFNVKGFDLTECQAPSEYAVVASGTSTRHVGALGEGVVYEVKKKFGLNPLSIEGVNEGRWALVDFGGLIVHIFYDFVRQEYKLEDLWKKKIDMQLKDSAASSTISFQP